MSRLIDANAIQYTDLNGDHPESKVRVYVAFKENIDRMPTVDAVPVRHGHWTDDIGIEGAWNYCSVCGEQAIDLYDYCPNCGARMDGKGNGDETD